MLNKIEVNGFKSFGKKTILEFSSDGVFSSSEGITAIVGPNGSGKSNVADAISWVLGEQSMKNLRSRKAEDVIFAGSGKKSKVGSASVSLFLDNQSKVFPVDYKEVVLTRKLFRSGESEFLINGSKVRLLDVVDILAKGGISKGSYSIINQGMTDRILVATPEQRKVIIEESVGVKEFQIKKERATKKLIKSLQNLATLEEVLKELRPNLKFLEKQADKVKEAEILKEKLQEKQRELFWILWQETIEKLENSQKEVKSIREKLKGFEKKEVEVEGRLTKENDRVFEKRQEIDNLESSKRNISSGLNDLERKIIALEARLKMEEEGFGKIRKIEIVPAGTNLVKESLANIKKQQDRLLVKMEAVKEVSQIQDLKKDIARVNQGIDVLYEAVIKGRLEKKVSPEKIKQQKDKIQAGVNRLKEEIESSVDLKKEKEAKLKSLQKKIDEFFREDQKKNQNKFELESELRKLRIEKEEIREVFDKKQIDLAKKEIRKEDLQSRIRNELGIFPSQLKFENEKKTAKESISLSVLEKEVASLKAKLANVGGVDESIVKEYEEVKERVEFLTGQSEDLTKTIEKLKRVVREMDKKTKDRFENFFEKIAVDFAKYFAEIFGGGKARLEKVHYKVKNNQEGELGDDSAQEQDLETMNNPKDVIGVDILAKPPGKRISSLNMLSGGERALTSMAFLFAIIARTRPPFVVLDEVEAALDESNSARFGKIVKKLSRKTQFIVITHNRETMRQAGILYGVTMGDDGVSRLLSVKLEEG